MKYLSSGFNHSILQRLSVLTLIVFIFLLCVGNFISTVSLFGWFFTLFSSEPLEATLLKENCFEKAEFSKIEDNSKGEPFKKPTIPFEKLLNQVAFIGVALVVYSLYIEFMPYLPLIANEVRAIYELYEIYEATLVPMLAAVTPVVSAVSVDSLAMVIYDPAINQMVVPYQQPINNGPVPVEIIYESFTEGIVKYKGPIILIGIGFVLGWSACLIASA